MSKPPLPPTPVKPAVPAVPVKPATPPAKAAAAAAPVAAPAAAAAAAAPKSSGYDSGATVISVSGYGGSNDMSASGGAYGAPGYGAYSGGSELTKLIEQNAKPTKSAYNAGGYGGYSGGQAIEAVLAAAAKKDGAAAGGGGGYGGYSGGQDIASLKADSKAGAAAGGYGGYSGGTELSALAADKKAETSAGSSGGGAYGGYTTGTVAEKPPAAAAAASPKKDTAAPAAEPSPVFVPPEVLALIAKDRDWNSEYQSLLDKLAAATKAGDAGVQTSGAGSGGVLKAAIDASDRQAESIEIERQIFSLVNEYCEAAKTLGRIVIAEAPLRNPQKSIKSFDAGGLAGGEKFKCYGIFFKRVMDDSNFYGGLESAMKAANHELKGARAYVRNVPSIRAGLVTVVDFRGYRVICSAAMPVSGSKTLIYGSQNAGHECDVIASDKVSAAMLQAGANLGLKPHKVGPGPQAAQYQKIADAAARTAAYEKALTVVNGPVDIEVHAGKDNRFYILDTARVFPPAPPATHVDVALIQVDATPLQFASVPKKDFPAYRNHVLGSGNKLSIKLSQFRCAILTAIETVPGAPLNLRASALVDAEIRGPALFVSYHLGDHLWNLLRPELVLAFAKKFNKPLSSDAFTGFGHHDWHIHNTEAGQAQEYLEQTVIPALATKIARFEVTISNGRQLCDLMHANGINIRHLGRLRSAIPEIRTRERALCLTEMVARYAKNNLRALLRDITSVEDGPFKKVILHFLNVMFGQSARSTHFWRVQVMCGIKEKFGTVFDAKEYEELGKTAKNEVDIRAYLDQAVLLQTIQSCTGVILTAACNARVAAAPSSLYTTEPFGVDDFAIVRASDKRIYWHADTVLQSVHSFIGTQALKATPAAATPAPTSGGAKDSKSDSKSEAVSAPVARALRMHETILKMFGAGSNEAIGSHLETARALVDSDEAAWTAANPKLTLWSAFTSKDVPVAPAGSTRVYPAITHLDTFKAAWMERLAESDLRIAYHLLRARAIRAAILHGFVTAVGLERAIRDVKIEYAATISALQRVYGDLNARVMMGTATVDVRKGNVLWLQAANGLYHATVALKETVNYKILMDVTEYFKSIVVPFSNGELIRKTFDEDVPSLVLEAQKQYEPKGEETVTDFEKKTKEADGFLKTVMRTNLVTICPVTSWIRRKTKPEVRSLYLPVEMTENEDMRKAKAKGDMRTYDQLKATYERLAREHTAQHGGGPQASEEETALSWSAEVNRFSQVHRLVPNPEFVGPSEADLKQLKAVAAAAKQPVPIASASGGVTPAPAAGSSAAAAAAGDAKATDAGETGAGEAPTEAMFESLLRPEGFNAAEHGRLHWGRFPVGTYFFTKQVMKTIYASGGSTTIMGHEKVFTAVNESNAWVTQAMTMTMDGLPPGYVMPKNANEMKHDITKKPKPEPMSKGGKDGYELSNQKSEPTVIPVHSNGVLYSVPAVKYSATTNMDNAAMTMESESVSYYPYFGKYKDESYRERWVQPLSSVATSKVFMKSTNTRTHMRSVSTLMDFNKTVKLPNGKSVGGCFIVKTEGKNVDDVEAWDASEMMYSLQWPGYSVGHKMKQKDRQMMREMEDTPQDTGVWTTEEIEKWKKTCAQITKMP